jgi:hypothetical protein
LGNLAHGMGLDLVLVKCGVCRLRRVRTPVVGFEVLHVVIFEWRRCENVKIQVVAVRTSHMKNSLKVSSK